MLLALTRRAVPFLLAAALALLVALAPHSARAALPAPGCAGIQVTDGAGDVSAMAGPTATNLDITGAYFVTDPKGVVTAHIQVADMSTVPPPPATAVTWYMLWTVGPTTYYVSVDANVLGEIVYEHGTQTESATGGTQYSPAGETTGTITEGPDGGVSAVVPKAAKGATGNTLLEPNAATFQLVQNGLGGGVLLFGDDTEPGASYSVGACELGAGSGAPAPPPSGGGTVRPPSGQPAAKLPLTLTTKSVKPKGRTATIKLKASGDVSQVAARLRKGRKVVATGKLARIASGATGSLKLKTRGKPKKGTYTLDVTGRLADGRLASAAYRLRLK